MVIGLGEILWDNLPGGRRLGGAPANFVFHVNQLGLLSCVVSAVGDDVLGQDVMCTLDGLMVKYHIAKVDKPTGEVFVKLDDRGTPSYEICENVAWDNIPFADGMKMLAEKASVVCFGTLAQRSECSRETIRLFLQSVKSDCIKVYDVNLRQNYYSRQIVEESMFYSDILKLNEDELIILKELLSIDGDDCVTVCRKIMNLYSVGIVVLTCGENGSYVMDENIVSFVETPKIDVVDTVGAGDAFTAAFVVAKLKGVELRRAHEMAVDIAAYVCTADGATPQLPENIKYLFR